LKEKQKNRILIIDALNMYFRAYIVDPSLSINGQPIGGVKGFLKIFQKLVRETKPDKVFIIWDGPGGSRTRKSINKNYKEGRKPLRLNRDIKHLTENEEIENKIWQQMRLIEYLNQLPIFQILIPEVEADDVISYVANMQRLRGWQKVIVSSDKDFFQLCDDETVLYRAVQKEVLNKKNIVETYEIHPRNFALARALVGDKSDNLKGVPGVGLRSVAKRFPFFREEADATLDDVLEECRKVDNKLKIYKNILENVPLIRENYKMMQLYVPILSAQSKLNINAIFDDGEELFNKTEIIKMMNEDGFGVYDWSSLFSSMRRVATDSS